MYIVHTSIYTYTNTRAVLFLYSQRQNKVHMHIHTQSKSMKAYRKKIKNNFKLAVTSVVKERGKKLRKNSPNSRGLQLYL